MSKMLVCCDCGYGNLEFMAKAEWNIKEQRFVYWLDEEYVYCPQCEDETLVEEVEIPEAIELSG